MHSTYDGTKLKNMFSRIFIYRHIWRIIYGWWLWKLCSSNIFFVLAGSWQSLQYECPTCGVSASKKQNLKTHIESAHWKSKLTRLNSWFNLIAWWIDRTKDHTCAICSWVFKVIKKKIMLVWYVMKLHFMFSKRLHLCDMFMSF